jgi:hypothetical protein
MLTLQAIVRKLAERCDGARRRDDEGFNKADAPTGHFLEAVDSKGLPWTHVEVTDIRNRLGKYSAQAAKLFTPDPEKQKKLAWVIQNKLAQVGCDPLPVPEQASKRPEYLSVSSDSRYLTFQTKDYNPRLANDIRSGFSNVLHGERRVIRPYFDQETGRWKVENYSTTAEIALGIAREHDLLIDIRATRSADPAIDEILMHRRSAFLATGKRTKICRGAEEHAVIDLLEKDERFLADLKRVVPHERRSYEDGAWWVHLDPHTSDALRYLLLKHGIAYEDQLAERLEIGISRRFA